VTLDELSDLSPESLLADGFEDAIIGVTVNHHHPMVVIYDYQKCIQVLMERDGLTDEKAVEYLDFKTLGAYVGEYGPLYMDRIEASDDNTHMAMARLSAANTWLREEIQRLRLTGAEREAIAAGLGALERLYDDSPPLSKPIYEQHAPTLRGLLERLK
jgi:hypothetical protein